MNHETLQGKWPDDAPEWANYIATDADGQVAWYEHEPYQGNDVWCWSHGKRLPVTTTAKYWRDTLIERPKPAKQKIDWSKVRSAVRDFWWKDNEFPSNWIAWNCDEHTRGNPLPDGLVVEWYEDGDGCTQNKYFVENQNWNLVTRFRIVGIQEGWE